MRVGELLRAVGEPGRGRDVRRGVLQVASGVLRLRDNPRPLHGAGLVRAARGDDLERIERRPLVRLGRGLEAIELVEGEQRALDEGTRDAVACRRGPRERLRAELARPRHGGRCAHARLLGIELLALAEAHQEDPPRAAVGGLVRDRHLLRGRLGLARLDQGLERRIVERLALENPYHAGVDVRLVGGTNSCPDRQRSHGRGSLMSDSSPLWFVGPADQETNRTMPKTVILGAARTPFGKLGGGLSSLDATDLGGKAIAAALERADVAPEQVEHVSYGQVLQAGQGQIPSRQAQVKAGIPKEVPSETINKVCASGIRSVGLVDQSIRLGDLDVAVAGGMESMSQAPYLLKEARFGYRMGDAKAIDAMINDGLTNPFSGKHMMEEASEVASELELTRPDMDRWALRSHQLAVKATDEGRLPEEIVSVTTTMAVEAGALKFTAAASMP